MQTTVDIPDGLYAALKAKAAAEGGSVEQLVLRATERSLGEASVEGQEEKSLPRLSGPFLTKGVPGSLKIDNEMIYAHIDFP